MASVMAGEEREQVIRWIEEGRNVMGSLLGILNDNDRLKGALDASEKECERLRGMLDELERVRSLAESLQRECDQLHAEVSRLRADNERGQREREEIAQSFTTFMNEAVSRLRTQPQPA
jgi:predicted RNase H-like nuclease (RuvC/YqgF family)